MHTHTCVYTCGGLKWCALNAHGCANDRFIQKLNIKSFLL